MSIPLSKIREQIDETDNKLVDLLNERAALVLEVKRTKQAGNIDIYAPERERQILDRILGRAVGGAFPTDALERIFSNIISASRSLIGELSVGYVGPESSLAHNAALKQFGISPRYLPERSIAEVIAKVERGETHFGVVPLRLGSSGIVGETVEALVQSKLVIIAEVGLRERLVLAGALNGLADVRYVFADPHAAERAFGWLRANAPGAVVEVVDSPVQAVERTKSSNASVAVLSDLAAERLDLNIVARGLEEDAEANTRFLVLGHRTPQRTGRDKTTVICAVQERAGALRELLKPFSDHGLTLLSIESRTIRRPGWEVGFFIDLEGHEADSEVAAAIEALSKIASSVRICGSYPLVC